ncbi:3-methyl-2-oxobutanoate hydroxymethyltransferase [Sediminibacillus dalangtanensis]|uniref:3-methyl-2-oxobutanoate hydroxymethyltransferase n=1 Tax=Sediminibacillus dalangtanensis TaxID=2729421 RepID=A0ABX7VSY6_9BACI|nr:3-methyl-2-oxobutanoate hydroxymethyltransferase [Sediminibacillus dalangtanensis]QTM99633.1 3-methyl-2-oxobutanoate hydroxymethyltransferase [Sediminibacillus dalangtanensis]
MLTVSHLQSMKDKGEKITMLTAYDYPSAKLAEQAGIDMLLVGDSLGMVVLGYASTVQVTIEDMIHHGKAVARGAGDTFLVVDMPFMSYHVSLENSLNNAKRIFQETNAHALKVEGATAETLRLIERMTAAGIPVIAHLGLTPQSVNVLGGFRVQGKDRLTAQRIWEEAQAVEKSGAAALVLECIPKELAEIITDSLSIPTIGIGAGQACDGQVLVYHDVLRYGVDRLPKFVKPYMDGNEDVTVSLKQYIEEVKSSRFPSDEHSFTMNHDFLPVMKREEEEQDGDY